MNRMIENYKHKMGSHCSSLQMSNILNYYGLNISEELCFGIGAGLGFIYRKAFNPPLYFVLGRSDDLEDKICYHIGAMAIPYTTDDNNKAWEEVKNLVDNNQPALINVDASYLEYMRKRFNLFNDVRYGGHRVSVIGYDEKNGIAYLSDYVWAEPQKVLISELKQAMGSKAGQTPPNNLFYTFLFPDKFMPIEDAIKKGIRLNVHTMLNPWYEVLGLPGLQKFCQRVVSWPKFMSPDLLKQNAYMTYMMLEVVGTGGGNFRRLFSRFLRKAEEIVKEPKLNQISKIYCDLGDHWKEIAHLLLESSKDTSKGLWEFPDKNQILLNEIYKNEEIGIYILREIFCE